jgi:hypothetical protein
MPFTKDAVELFISDKITAVTVCEAQPIADELSNSKNWISGYGLSVIFNNHPPDRLRPFTIQFLRRFSMAIAEHERMRVELVGLVTGDPQWSAYYRALHHAEQCCALTYQAYDYIRKLTTTRMFQSGDKSILDRLNLLYNSAKHSLALQRDPIWLTNDGLECDQGSLSFQDLETLIRDFGAVAEQLAYAPKPAA